MCVNALNTDVWIKLKKMHKGFKLISFGEIKRNIVQTLNDAGLGYYLLK